uniref:Nuclear receptor subfamily 1 group I member 3 n=1 Tax=Sphenodon punctatus TaxID=8508 RepID=A0A8D0GUT9_SPHPU
MNQSKIMSNSSSAPCALGRRDAADPKEEEKACAVCGDRATGYHFHVMTCEGCKGFFRRSVSKGVRFTCPFTRSCTITKAKRRQCQACRLQKCLAVGMRKDMIMSDEALQLRRTLRSQKKQEPGVMGEPEGLTPEQEQLIEILIEAHNRNFDSSFSAIVHCRVSTAEGGAPVGGVTAQGVCIASDKYSNLPHFADVSTFMIQQVIKFAKEIPDFRSLPIDDQISLLKGATLEICQIQFNTVFNEETKVWECGPHWYTIQDGALAWGACPIVPSLSLWGGEPPARFADHTSFIQRDFIDRTQEKVALTLKSYIDQRHPLPEGRFLYAKLLLLLTELRTLKLENTSQILHIQDYSSMMPLLSEIIS